MSEALWINGFAIPESEHRYYFNNSKRHHGFIEHIYNEKKNEYTAVYSLGVLLYELITGDTDDTEIPNIRTESRIKISDEQNGVLIDLTNAFRAAYDNKYTISNIKKDIDML